MWILRRQVNMRQGPLPWMLICHAAHQALIFVE